LVFNVCFLNESTLLYRYVLGYVDPKKPDVDAMHEWFFRSGLDRYVWIYGMICAFFHPRYEAALKWIDERPAPARVAIQSAILAVTLAVTAWWYNTYYVLPKLEYNVVHPYTSWIPITCFIILRNLTQVGLTIFTTLFCGAVRLVQLVSRLGAIAPVCPSLSIRWQTGPKRRRDMQPNTPIIDDTLYGPCNRELTPAGRECTPTRGGCGRGTSRSSACAGKSRWRRTSASSTSGSARRMFPMASRGSSWVGVRAALHDAHWIALYV
jgi:hypothetical protein